LEVQRVKKNGLVADNKEMNYIKIEVKLSQFVPIPIMENMIAFLGGSADFWTIQAYINYRDDFRFVAASGNLFTPNLLDLLIPYLGLTPYEIQARTFDLPSNRGSWMTQAVRAVLQQIVLTAPQDCLYT